MNTFVLACATLAGLALLSAPPAQALSIERHFDGGYIACEFDVPGGKIALVGETKDGRVVEVTKGAFMKRFLATGSGGQTPYRNIRPKVTQMAKELKVPVGPGVVVKGMCGARATEPTGITCHFGTQSGTCTICPKGKCYTGGWALKTKI